MSISASQVSELRKTTDCGMMDCKKALVEADGDMAKAIEILRKKGMAKAAKKADRVAAEGLIEIVADGKNAVLVEVNSETDFVARDSNFRQFVQQIAKAALEQQVKDTKSLLELSVDGNKTVNILCQELIVKLGENINIRRIAFMRAESYMGSYVHGGRIGVLVALKGGNAELAKDIAMHIAASKPLVISPEEVAQEVINEEKEIYLSQAIESGKPVEIAEKMVAGKIKKFLDEVSLLGQPFVKDTNEKVGQLLNSNGAEAVSFVRFELGEGVTKKEENFAEEVMAQVNKQ